MDNRPYKFMVNGGKQFLGSDATATDFLLKAKRTFIHTPGSFHRLTFIIVALIHISTPACGYARPPHYFCVGNGDLPVQEVAIAYLATVKVFSFHEYTVLIVAPLFLKISLINYYECGFRNSDGCAARPGLPGSGD